jgi:hypothetical protein
MTGSNNSLRNIMVSFEAAYEAAALLEDKQVLELEGVTVYSGKHPEHGNVHITIPAIGDGLLLLPFALHAF